MNLASDVRASVEEGARLWRGVTVILIAGVALGLAQNALMRRGETVAGLKDYQRRSLTWIKREVVAPRLEDVASASVPADGAPAATEAAPEPKPAPGPEPKAEAAPAPPPAPVATQEAAALPPIPNLPHPLQMQLPAVKLFFDRDAATIVDARTREEYAEGHIPGSISLPYDEAITDPAKLESFDAKGRPIIVYCGGGTCELSMNLAFAMLQAGQKKLLVYMGGFPEWQGAGYPVATGGEPGAAR